ncbi:MAG: hypothetical protein AMXMBFR44_2330 [Candidatus Campbellbacteria bacterium]
MHVNLQGVLTLLHHQKEDFGARCGRVLHAVTLTHVLNAFSLFLSALFVAYLPTGLFRLVFLGAGVASLVQAARDAHMMWRAWRG